MFTRDAPRIILNILVACIRQAGSGMRFREETTSESSHENSEQAQRRSGVGFPGRARLLLIHSPVSSHVKSLL